MPALSATRAMGRFDRPAKEAMRSLRMDAADFTAHLQGYRGQGIIGLPPYLANLQFQDIPTMTDSRNMTRRFALQAAAIVPLIAAFPMLARAQATPNLNAKNRIVIQVSDADPGKWNLALNNARNLQEDVGAANVAIEIVAYGPGIGMLKGDATTANRIGDAIKSGIAVMACENTMRGQKLSKDDMHPQISYVPAGVTEIMRKQGEGWSYLRP